MVDAAASGTVLVTGSLPPGGRDLDLLVADADVPLLADALAAAGYEPRGTEWARFDGPRVALVDLEPASAWGLPAGELEALLAGARPLAGHAHLREPAPAHVLLILARRRLGLDGPLAAKHRARIAAAEAADPGAWTAAAACSPAWGVAHALAVLRSASRDGTVAPALRARARLERARAAGPRAGAALLLRDAAPTRRRGAVVALSGIDGSGKSTQAAGLALTLADLGLDATVQWSRITYDPLLRRLGAGPKRVLGWLARRRPADGAGTSTADVGDSAVDPADAAAGALRARFATLDHGWTLVVAVVHALSQRRALAPHLRAGEVVVRDRYVLDATVQLRSVYGEGRSVRLPAAVLRRACPAPAAAFWLDVDPEEAYRRKPEEYTAAELAAHRAGYAAVHAALGVERVDAGASPEALAADLARRVWQRLG